MRTTNCCQPRHLDGLAAPEHTGVEKNSELSWSVKAFSTGDPTPPILPVSVRLELTWSNVPVACEIVPVT